MDAAHDHEKVTRGQAAHEDAHQALDRREHPPRLRQHHIAVAKGGVGDSGKVERGFEIGQTSAPQIEEAPDRNLRQMEQDQPPDHTEQQPRDWPDAGWLGMQSEQTPNQHGDARSMHSDCEGRQNARAEEH